MVKQGRDLKFLRTAAFSSSRSKSSCINPNPFNFSNKILNCIKFPSYFEYLRLKFFPYLLKFFKYMETQHQVKKSLKYVFFSNSSTTCSSIPDSFMFATNN